LALSKNRLNRIESSPVIYSLVSVIHTDITAFARNPTVTSSKSSSSSNTNKMGMRKNSGYTVDKEAYQIFFILIGSVFIVIPFVAYLTCKHKK